MSTIDDSRYAYFLPSISQNLAVKGSVVDKNGEAIIGANILVKGTTNGSITDFDGNFSLKAKVGNTLVVSYVGYSTQEVKISKQTGNRIVLKEDAEVLTKLLSLVMVQLVKVT